MTPLSGALPKGYIGKGAPRERLKPGQRMRRYLKRGPLKARKSRPKQIGRQGKAQAAWQGWAKSWWREHLPAEAVRCAVTGDTDIVFGHILSQNDRPDLKKELRNGAPITAQVNKRMFEDPEFEVYAQGLMIQWVNKWVEPVLRGQRAVR